MLLYGYDFQSCTFLYLSLFPRALRSNLYYIICLYKEDYFSNCKSISEEWVYKNCIYLERYVPHLRMLQALREGEQGLSWGWGGCVCWKRRMGRAEVGGTMSFEISHVLVLHSLEPTHLQSVYWISHRGFGKSMTSIVIAIWQPIRFILS